MEPLKPRSYVNYRVLRGTGTALLCFAFLVLAIQITLLRQTSHLATVRLSIANAAHELARVRRSLPREIEKHDLQTLVAACKAFEARMEVSMPDLPRPAVWPTTPTSQLLGQCEAIAEHFVKQTAVKSKHGDTERVLGRMDPMLDEIESWWMRAAHQSLEADSLPGGSPILDTMISYPYFPLSLGILGFAMLLLSTTARTVNERDRS